MKSEIEKKWIDAPVPRRLRVGSALRTIFSSLARAHWLLTALLCLLTFSTVRAQTAITITLIDKQWPSSPGFQLIHATAHVADKDIPLITGIFLPPAYFQTKQPFPLVMTLHNGGEGSKILSFEGLALLMAKDDPDERGSGEKPKNAVNLRTQAQFVGLIPQLPSGYRWENPEMARILDALITQIASVYRIDLDRVYLTGFSYGGSSTWRVAILLPDRFAAIAPLDGRATPYPSQDVKKLKKSGIYLSVGGADGEFIDEAERMRDALVADKHLRFVYRVVPNGNHWNYASVYTDPDFWKWMFSQSRHGVTSIPTLATAGDSTHPASASPATPQNRTILCQYWRDLPGKNINDLTNDPAFPKFPDEQLYLDQMEIPPNQEPGYGTVLRGLLRAPQTGDYTFYIASDNQGELWLSEDDKPDHLKQIAAVREWSLPREWTRDAAQQSMPVHLLADKNYYLQALQKSGGGDNHLAVAWKLPDQTMEGPIPGSRFAMVPALLIPPPAITAMDPKELPAKPGSYRLKMDVDYLGRHQTVALLLVLPHDYPKASTPGLIFYADTDQKGGADGFREQGPVKELSGDAKLAAWSPLVIIAPQCLHDQSWETHWMQHATTAVVNKLIHDLNLDEQALYLTGSGAGGTAVWKISELMPHRFAAVAPICPWEVRDPQLPAALDGTAVHIITGVKNGMATDCANRMKTALSAIHPAPEVIYEMKMGSEVADAYYANQDFYQWLLSWHRQPGKSAVEK